MTKKGILVNIDPGNTPLVFVVPGEAVTHEQEERLERLIELFFSTEFEFVDVHEVSSLKELHDMVIEDHGEPGKKYPSFEDPVSDEDGAKLMGVSVARYKERTARQEDKIKKFREHYCTTSGRLSSKGGHLANLPKSGPEYSISGRHLKYEPTFHHISPKDYDPPKLTSIDTTALKKSLVEKLKLTEANFSTLERRVMAAMLEGNLYGVFDDYVVIKGEEGHWTAKESNLQEIPRYHVKTPNGSLVSVTWQQCSPECPGWLHMNEPYEIEECDECTRFDAKVDAPSGSQEEMNECAHDLAVKAHKEECGCGWPDFDVQNAAMAWAKDMGPEMDDGVQELRNLLDERGVQFMDNVTPAIYACSRILETSGEGSPNHTAGLGLMKLLKETQEKIHNEELKLKDFGNPPGAEEG